MSRIVLSGIRKTLGNLLTLKEVSLEAEEGTIAGILGPSGCGKSTLLNIVAGLIRPDAGTVMIDGMNVTGKTGQVSYMQQKDLLLPSRSTLDNIAIPLILKGVPLPEARSEVRRHLDAFGFQVLNTIIPTSCPAGCGRERPCSEPICFPAGCCCSMSPSPPWTL